MYEILEINQNYCYIKEQDDGSLNENLTQTEESRPKFQMGNGKKLIFNVFKML